MNVGIDEARKRLEELLDRAAAGEAVVIERGDRRRALLWPLVPENAPSPVDPADRLQRIAEIQARVAAKRLPPDVDAARSADHLYDEDGFPR